MINDSIRVKKVISTIPLREIVTYLDSPKHVLRAAKELDYNSVMIVGIALNREAPNQHWVYVPEKSIVFHRYAWISNYSPSNAPTGKSALIAEITIPPSQKVSEDYIIHKTIEGLKALDVISEGEREIILVKVWKNTFGYPIYTKGHNEARKEIVNFLENRGIISVGRWGSWHYWNMDKVYNAAKKVAYDVFL